MRFDLINFNHIFAFLFFDLIRWSLLEHWHDLLLLFVNNSLRFLFIPFRSLFDRFFVSLFLFGEVFDQFLLISLLLFLLNFILFLLQFEIPKLLFLSLFLGLLFFLLLLLEGPLLVLYKLFFQLFSLSLLLLLKLYLLSLLLFFVFLFNFFALDFILLLLSDFDLKQDRLDPLMGELD